MYYQIYFSMDVKQLISVALLVEMKNNASTMINSMVLPYKNSK